MIEDLVRKNRSYRRFYSDFAISDDTLRNLVNLARLSASAGNLQPLKYIVSSTADSNEMIFPCLSWAAYLKDWPGPAVGERPTAYIVVLGDTEITKNFNCDHGIAAQSILLGATEQGLGGCIVGSIDRARLAAALDIDKRYQILLVIALGRPKERVVIEQAVDGIEYWRNHNSVHHVPKRPLEEIILSPAAALKRRPG